MAGALQQRNHPHEQPGQLQLFLPPNDACLEHLWQARYGDEVESPKCGKVGKFYRLSKETAYSCPRFGHHIRPMVGTPFEKSRTPLQKWFYAMYLFTTTRHGVSAKELKSQLGVRAYARGAVAPSGLAARVGRRGDEECATRSPSPPLGAERAGVRWGLSRPQHA